jgi:hypothetical protein
MAVTKRKILLPAGNQIPVSQPVGSYFTELATLLLIREIHYQSEHVINARIKFNAFFLLASCLL